ncbi:MAG: glycosyltransferase family 25 protein [Cyclobacteriaceae bacterium]
MSIPIFVISLKDSEKRRRSIATSLNKIGVNFEFFDAVYGAGLEPQEIENLCDSEALRKNPRWLNRGAIGCSLSHYYLYKKIVDENIDGAIILEDDMMLDHRFLEVLGFLEKRNCKDNEVVMLYYRSFSKLQFKRLNDIGKTGLHIAQPLTDSDIPITTGGYYVTSAACKSLATFILPVRVTADSWNYFLKEGALESIKVVYPRILSDGSFKSVIDYNQAYKNGFIANLSRLLNSRNIPLISYILKSRRKKLENSMSEFELTER